MGLMPIAQDHTPTALNLVRTPMLAAPITGDIVTAPVLATPVTGPPHPNPIKRISTQT